MSAEAQTHCTRVEVEGVPTAEVAIGSDLALTVKVSCCVGCDLDGSLIDITGPDGAVAAYQLSGLDAQAYAAGCMTFKAPQTVGQHDWRVLFPHQEIAGIRHEASTVAVCVTTRPHATSLAVWAVPAYVMTGERFAIKVGARSSAGCALQNQTIEICDDTNTIAARGRLQPSPWPGTSALYWTEVELVAPANDGVSSWSARFAPKALESAHEGTSSQFHVAVVRPPEHTVTVKVVEKENTAPIDNVQVRLGAYRGATDKGGLAQIRVSKGRYDLSIWKVGYEAPATTIDIDRDVAMEIEALRLPLEDPDTAWRM